MWELNLEVIIVFMKLFKINTPYMMSSSLEIKTLKTKRIIDICRTQNADEYFSGQGAKAYLDNELFLREGVKLSYQEFKAPEYTQNYKGFVPNLSALDYLFNCGGRKD